MKHVLFAVGALGALGSAQAAELLDSYKLALRNDPQLQAAAAERDALIEAKPQARAAVLP